MTKALEFTLQVNRCLGCSMCPQDKLGAAYTSPKTRMTIQDFDTMLNKVPKDVQIHPSGFSEPFLHPNACDMIGSAIVKGYQVWVYSTLVGLKPGCIDVLSVYKPHFWRVHVPDGKQFVFNEEKWIEQHELFLLAKIHATYMAMAEPSEFIKRHFALKGIPVELPDMLSRAGNLWTPKKRPIEGPITCEARRWHMNVCLPNGDVVLCSMDYSLKMPVGNLLRDSYEDVYAASEKYRENLNPGADSPCRYCDWARPA